MYNILSCQINDRILNHIIRNNMKNYIIEIGNFKGEQGWKFSSDKTDRNAILSDFVNKVVILGTSKFLKGVFLGEDARCNTDQPVTIVETN